MSSGQCTDFCFLDGRAQQSQTESSGSSDDALRFGLAGAEAGAGGGVCESSLLAGLLTSVEILGFLRGDPGGVVESASSGCSLSSGALRFFAIGDGGGDDGGEEGGDAGLAGYSGSGVGSVSSE